ncbi:MAG: MFS transporter, partial [Deltaproteobacteria bacterium]|nr:MFS transporter [Deltaproteobacteria bacterium]
MDSHSFAAFVLCRGLFRLRLFRICSGLAWLSAMGIFGVISYLPLYAQGVLGSSASRAGMALLLASLGWTTGSFIGGQGMNRFGYRAASVAGMLLMTAGYGLFPSTRDHLGLVAVLVVGFVIGLGMGIVNVTSMVAAQNGVPLNQLGVATSTVMLCRMFGGAFGITLMGSVLISQMQRRLVTLSTASG